MKKVVLTAGARTPVGAFTGGLKTVPVEELAALTLKANLEKMPQLSAEDIDDVILGHVESSMDATNLGRVAALLAGFDKVPAYTVNRVCGSGIQSIINASQAIKLGDADVILAGGAESMSRAPFYLPLESRYEGLKGGDKPLKDANLQMHYHCQPFQDFGEIHMANTAENINRKFNISREAQDEFAYESQMKVKAATEKGRFAKEIIPVEVKGRRGQVTIVEADEHPRFDTNLEKLAKLRPAFEADGSVTAGNASGINDGAAAVTLMSEEKAQALGIEPMVEIVNYAVAALEPEYMGLGPVYAINKLLEKTGMTKDDIALWEINEAFAGQTLGCLQELGMEKGTIYYDRVNVNGGAIALGHPLGMSGTRITLSLAIELIDQEKEYGIASACIGGGMGIAILIRNPRV